MSLERIKQIRLKRAIERFEKREARKKAGSSAGAGKFCLKVLATLLILSLNWFGLFAIGNTFAYFIDQEMAQENSLAAGNLDFSLDSGSDFSPSPITLGQVSERTIDISQDGSLGFQYSVKASDFSGDVCNYLNLEAKLVGDIKYQGLLKDFVFEPLFYSTSSLNSWHFALGLPDGVPDILQETTCQFKFIFNAWQDSLTISTEGFSDTEEILNSINTAKWVPELLTPLDGAVINGSFIEQCWSPVAGASAYFYQSCNNDPDIDGYCDERWHEEYATGSGQFVQACKWASGVANADYWWRVKAIFGSASSSPGFSGAWKITVDNSHSNKVVIDEFLPNAVGCDTAVMPNGEWVELYNNKGQDVGVAGWVIYDVDNSHALPITNANTDTGNTLIRSGGYLVVYRNGDADFALNNLGGDTVRLFDKAIGSGGTLVDSYSYTADASEGKSFARVPAGSNNWVDPVPTPGGPNVLGDEEAILGSSEIIIEPGEEDTVILNSTPESSQISPATSEMADVDDLGDSSTTTDELASKAQEATTSEEATTTEQPSEPESEVIVSQEIQEIPAIDEQPPVLEEQPAVLPEDTPAAVGIENSSEAPAGDLPPQDSASVVESTQAVDNAPVDVPASNESL
ncbi:MAG: lamin tail domain-containing protein [Candidatus Pacebacteria bacterium]|nr:lamin tail domain-containing protein [Candidatus Paceibacterota bacterium]